jgi:hypothetical protein
VAGFSSGRVWPSLVGLPQSWVSCRLDVSTGAVKGTCDSEV